MFRKIVRLLKKKKININVYTYNTQYEPNKVRNSDKYTDSHWLGVFRTRLKTKREEGKNQKIIKVPYSFSPTIETFEIVFIMQHATYTDIMRIQYYYIV